jgi:hypothetical protein
MLEQATPGAKSSRYTARMQPLTIGAAAVLTISVAAQAPAARETVLGTFVGTTPADAALLRTLDAAANAKAEIIEWSLTLYHDPQTGASSRYELRAAYGLTEANRPGIALDLKRAQRRGRWTRAGTTAPRAADDVMALDNGLSLARFGDTHLHFLDRDRRLMTGRGGWSYTLSRADAADEHVDIAPLTVPPPESYTILPVATGPNVFGVFEGRTPCQGIARALQWPVDASCRKLKWRVTLFHDPVTRAPTTYRMEGTLFRSGPQEGRWRLVDAGPTSRRARVFRLEGTGAAPALSLFEADPNVVFCLKRDGRLLAGTAEFGYTLDRQG